MNNKPKRQRQRKKISLPAASAKPGERPVLRKINDTVNTFIDRYGVKEYKWIQMQAQIACL